MKFEENLTPQQQRKEKLLFYFDCIQNIPEFSGLKIIEDFEKLIDDIPLIDATHEINQGPNLFKACLGILAIEEPVLMPVLKVNTRVFDASNTHYCIGNLLSVIPSCIWLNMQLNKSNNRENLSYDVEIPAEVVLQGTKLHQNYVLNIPGIPLISPIQPEISSQILDESPVDLYRRIDNRMVPLHPFPLIKIKGKNPKLN